MSHISQPIDWTVAVMNGYYENEYGLVIKLLDKADVIMKRENWNNSFEITRSKLFDLPNNKLVNIKYATWNGWNKEKYFCDVKICQKCEDELVLDITKCCASREGG